MSYELGEERFNDNGFAPARLGAVANVMGCGCLDMLEAKTTISRTALDRWFFDREDPTDYGWAKIGETFELDATRLRRMCNVFETEIDVFRAYLDVIRY